MHVCVESASSSSSSSVGWIQKPLEKKSKILSMKKCPYRGKKRRDRGEGCVDDATGTVVITRGHFFANATAARGVPGCDDFWFCLVQSKAKRTYDLSIGVLQYCYTSAHVHSRLLLNTCQWLSFDPMRSSPSDVPGRIKPAAEVWRIPNWRWYRQTQRNSIRRLERRRGGERRCRRRVDGDVDRSRRGRRWVGRRRCGG